MKKRATNERENARAGVIVYTVAAILAAAGLADATYLTVASLTGESLVCGGSAGCGEVLGSAYSRIGSIPIAGFGAAAYFVAFACATFAAFGSLPARKFFVWAAGGMFLTTLYLLFLQAFVLHAFCRYCLISAAITFALAGVAVASPRAQ